MSVLESGGSAGDAAVAGMLAAGVTQPVSSGLGGGGFALMWDAGAGRATFLDFRETAPIGLRPEDLQVRPVAASRRGLLVGVPSELAGLAAIHDRFGKVAFGELFRPAIKLAKEGFEVSPHLHRSLRWTRHFAEHDPRAKAVFAPAGVLASRGDRLSRPALAATLERLASEGPAALYGGSLGDELVGTVQAARGRLAAVDLQGYRVQERTPLTVSWNDEQIITAPPPSAGGLLVAETLLMHRPAELKALGYGSGAYLHLLAETFRSAQDDRLRFIGDPAFIKMDVGALLAPRRLTERRGRMSIERTLPQVSHELEESGTSQLVVRDGAGNVAVVVSSLNDMFGAELLSASGVVLNDQLSAFTPPRVERTLRSRVKPNRAHGGARPVASMCPTLVLDRGHPVLALGASGGTRIPTAVTQVLLAVSLFGRTPREAVGDMRIQTPFGGGLRVEPSAAEPLLTDLRTRGEVVTRQRPDYSAVQLLQLGDDGPLSGASDPRKGGVVLLR